MKAVIYTQYGSPDVLELKEVNKPEPKENEVLIKIHATSINASDNEFLRGTPFYVRMWGLFKPKINILGSDIAGTIEEVGKNVTQFTPCDEVFGDIFETWGGFAEYVCASENDLVLKPNNLSFEEVAAFPQASVVALQGLQDKGQIQSGKKVLINGAGGGAGTFAIQFAKLFGAKVTGVDNASKLDLMKSIGADHVIDYQKEDFTQKDQSYDLILDFVAYRSILDYKRVLSPNGKYVMVGGDLSRIFQLLLLTPLISVLSKKKMGILAHQRNRDDLNYILGLYQAGKIKPIIDKYFSLNEAAEAMNYLGEGHSKGKLVITIE